MDIFQQNRVILGPDNYVMEPRIETLTAKKLIGQSLTTCFANDRTFELWSGFMPRRKEIKHSVGKELYSIQIYAPDLKFTEFNAQTEYEKWAAIEVSDLQEVPAGMKQHILQGGLYAVFIYKGRASDFKKTFEFIFYQWLPNSIYDLDQREHFEILGDKYKNDHPDSEEEVWVPIRRKL